MKKSDKLKDLVKKNYGQVAKDKTRETSCCGPESCCSGTSFLSLNDDYKKFDGYQSEADLGLGCGIPTAHIEIGEGDTVVDLGSGAGNDAFIVRNLVGDSGAVIGIDMTPEMIEKARVNNAKAGFENVDFRLGDIEKIPVENDTADIVISNCVLNLVPDKRQAFREIFRILKPGGRFAISDIVLKGSLPKALKEAAELYVGCVAGAIDDDIYLEIIEKAGFEQIHIAKEHRIPLPDETLKKYLNEQEMNAYKKNKTAVLSITVTARKPAPAQ
ncbi:MAG: arsenite methyltransferase [Candidatus Zixiibacteriota bacterium]